MNKIFYLFSSQKCIDSFIVNLIGSQPFRYSLAKILYNLKLFFTYNKTYKEIIDEGHQKVTNFLSIDEFEKINKEYLEAIENKNISKETIQVDGKYDDGIKYITLEIDEKIKDLYPNLFNLKNHDYIKKYFTTGEQKKNIKIFCRLERIIVKDNAIKDPNKDYHYDTFHNTFKAWLFMSNVNVKDGPFLFVPNTHKFSFQRMLQEWWLSLLFSLKKNNASFRFGNEENKKKELDNKAVKFDVEQNTFVMANTHALHRRGDAEVGAIRDSIQFWSRENPFKIFL